MTFHLAEFTRKNTDDSMLGIFRVQRKGKPGFMLQLGNRKSQTQWHQEFFSDEQYGGEPQALASCQQKRDELLSEKAFKDFYSAHNQEHKPKTRAMHSTNTTGVTGVTFAKIPMSKSYIFKAQYGQNLLGTFSAKKHSLEGAFFAAAKLRLAHDNEEYDESVLSNLFNQWVKEKINGLREQGLPIYMSELDAIPESERLVKATHTLNSIDTAIPNVLIQAKRSSSHTSLKAHFTVLREGIPNKIIDISDLGFKKATALAIREASKISGEKLSENQISWRANKWCKEHAEIIEMSGIPL